MSDPFLGEMRVFPFNFAPKGWAQCNGQLLAINTNQALFSLLGTMYGGDGRVNFALPDLRGRVPAHFGQSWNQGQRMGEEQHTLIASETPIHTHPVVGSQAAATTNSPLNAYLATSPGGIYGPPDANNVALAGATLTNAGGSQPHENRQPYLSLNICMAIQGIFPSRN